MRNVVLIAAVGLVLTASGLAGQEPVSLDRVEELAGQGRTEEARAELVRWWAGSGASAARREIQRGIWLRGRLTVNPGQADLDFRRLVIEYPGGPYSDQALFRLAQSAYASGDSITAVAQVDRLAREYPSSVVRREAEAWIATAGPLPPPVPGGVGAVAGPAPQSEPAAADAAPSAADRFTLQLGAFSSEQRADVLFRRAAEAGFDSRVVKLPGSDLVRVRVGRFDSAEGADAILRRLEQLGFTAALARDAHLEERVGR